MSTKFNPQPRGPSCKHSAGPPNRKASYEFSLSLGGGGGGRARRDAEAPAQQQQANQLAVPPPQREGQAPKLGRMDRDFSGRVTTNGHTSLDTTGKPDQNSTDSRKLELNTGRPDPGNNGYWQLGDQEPQACMVIGRSP